MNLNLKALFPSYRYFRSKPTQLSYDSHIFYHHETKEWFSISKHEVSQRDYEWLTVFILKLPLRQFRHQIYGMNLFIRMVTCRPN